VTSGVIPRDYSVFMTNVTQVRFAPAVASMRDYLEPHLPWLEKVVGCAFSDTVTFEIELPIGRLVIDDLLNGVPLDDEAETPRLRSEIDHWEIAAEASPRISLAPSRRRGTSVVGRQPAWHAEWQDCPIAVWMKEEPRAFVIANVPYVSFQQGLFSKWKGWGLRDGNLSLWGT
jgi:hypothetical protein